MGEDILSRWCPKCRAYALTITRGSVTQCCVCGRATSKGRVIAEGEMGSEQKRALYRLDDDPLDEVAE